MTECKGKHQQLTASSRSVSTCDDPWRHIRSSCGDDYHRRFQLRHSRKKTKKIKHRPQMIFSTSHKSVGRLKLTARLTPARLTGHKTREKGKLTGHFDTVNTHTHWAVRYRGYAWLACVSPPCERFRLHTQPVPSSPLPYSCRNHGT